MTTNILKKGHDPFATITYVNEIVQQVVYVPYEISTITGNYVSGTVSGVQNLSDGQEYLVDEVAGVPGYEIRATISGVDSFNRIWCHVLYEGLVDHIVHLDVYNYNTTNWDNKRSFTTTTAYQWLEAIITDDTDYIDDGYVQLRIYHVSSGNPAHDIHIDYLVIAKAGFGSAGKDHGALTGLLDDDHPQYHNNTRGDARYYTQSQVDALITESNYNLDGGNASSVYGGTTPIDGGDVDSF